MHIPHRFSLTLLCLGCLGGSIALANDELEAYLRVKKRLDNADAATRAKLEAKLKDTEIEMAKARQVQIEESTATPGIIKSLSRPRIRRTYANLLSTEAIDLTSLAGEQSKILKDTKGALFSYTNDLQTREETWNSKAALLWPIVLKTGMTPRSGEFSVPVIGLMPSVALNRVTTNRVPKDAADLQKIGKEEADELTYRLGLWATASTPLNVELVGRLNAGLKTDTGHQGRETFMEAELEPLWQSPDVPWIGLGYFAVPPALQKSTFDYNNPKTWRDTYLAYQARLRGRYIAGSVDDDGLGNEGPSFARAGLTAEINFDPFIWDRLHAFLSWTYLGTINGPVGEEQFVEAGLGLVLWENAGKDQRVTIDATYSWGAEDNLGAEVQDVFNVSIGILY